MPLFSEIPPVPRFVFLRHDLPAGSPRGSHFDLMFEADGVLLTWAVDRLPQLDGPAVAATPLPPHRLAYLDYEGPVSNDRGTVRRIASGTCTRVAPDEKGDGGRFAEMTPVPFFPGVGTPVEFEIHGEEVRGRIRFAAGEVRWGSCSDRSF